MTPSCHTGPQSDIPSVPAVHDLTYSITMPLSPIICTLVRLTAPQNYHSLAGGFMALRHEAPKNGTARETARARIQCAP